MTSSSRLAARLRLLLLLALPAVVNAAEPAATSRPDSAFGRNPTAGQFRQLNGIRIYFERYGSGSPILMIHGNGQDLASMGNQIRFFARSNQVIAADSRGHGRSGLGSGRLTYEQMAEDASALLSALEVKSADVLGWSDGGIVGLLLAQKHPEQVAKLAIMGANLRPDGAETWALDWVAREEAQADAMIAKADTNRNWSLYKQHLDLLRRQPNIPSARLREIVAPTLVMAGDRDVIRGEHTLEIFQNLRRSQLCIFPGATHMIPWENPDLFNQTVAKFFREPFRAPDTRSYFAPPSAEAER